MTPRKVIGYAPKPLTALQAVCAALAIVAVLSGGVLVAWLAGRSEGSAPSVVEQLIAGRLFGL